MFKKDEVDNINEKEDINKKKNINIDNINENNLTSIISINLEKNIESNNIMLHFFNKLINVNLKDFIKGNYYGCLHFILMIFGIFILLFSTNKIHLIILLLVVSLDSIALVMLNLCPLSLLENKYLQTNYTSEKCTFLQHLGINYKCDHIYEYQLELLINFWTLTVIKIFFIIILEIFNIKIHDFSNIFIKKEV